ncbi:RHS repeat-associated core domain-containing protein [Planctomycetota bacterium]
MILSGCRLLSDNAYSTDLAFYVNGTAAELTDLNGFNTDQGEGVMIGSDVDDEGGYFEGKIDNVMIFDRALSGAEVQALAEADNDNVLSVTATVYDEAGNLTTDYRGYQYSYDYENRLLEIKDSDDTSIVAYAYDALGRRIQKDDKIAGQKTRYYNNHDWQVLAEYDDNGYHLRSYIYGGYIDEVLVMVDPNAAEDYYYAHNHLYSPTALLDDAGDIIERYDYDVYGRPYFLDPNLALSATQSSSYKNTVLFTGRTVDILDNGSLTLQYNRNRYYDYQTGRWMTKDISGYIDGINLYQYVRSNSITNVDPMGLKPEKQCSINGNLLSMLYNGSELIIHDECWKAASGKPINKTLISTEEYYKPSEDSYVVVECWEYEFDYSPENQDLYMLGPIPEESYWLDICDLASITGWGFRQHAWRHLLDWRSWGFYSVRLYPEEDADLGTRTGEFFIHGGVEWGSAGCIDIRGYDQLMNNLFGEVFDDNTECCYIPVEVDYEEETGTQVQCVTYNRTQIDHPLEWDLLPK